MLRRFTVWRFTILRLRVAAVRAGWDWGSLRERSHMTKLGMLVSYTSFLFLVMNKIW